jgi:hypothetical protein
MKPVKVVRDFETRGMLYTRAETVVNGRWVLGARWIICGENRMPTFGTAIPDRQAKIDTALSD